MGVQYAKAMGLRVLVVDHGAEKKKLSLERGAEAFVDFVDCPDVAAEVKKITGGGAHAVVVSLSEFDFFVALVLTVSLQVTGGTAGAYSSAPMLLRKAGVQVCVG